MLAGDPTVLSVRKKTDRVEVTQCAAGLWFPVHARIGCSPDSPVTSYHPTSVLIAKVESRLHKDRLIHPPVVPVIATVLRAPEVTRRAVIPTQNPNCLCVKKVDRCGACVVDYLQSEKLKRRIDVTPGDYASKLAILSLKSYLKRLPLFLLVRIISAKGYKPMLVPGPTFSTTPRFEGCTGIANCQAVVCAFKVNREERSVFNVGS